MTNCSAKIKKISRGNYIVNGCKVEYQQNGRYDLFDGKYHPGWVVTLPNGESRVSVDKKSAFQIAINL